MRILNETGSRENDVCRLFSSSGREKREYDCEPIESVVLEPKLFFIGCPLLKT
jgi:hypothetical protein